jgi:hypothetical protein
LNYHALSTAWPAGWLVSFISLVTESPSLGEKKESPSVLLVLA